MGGSEVSPKGSGHAARVGLRRRVLVGLLVVANLMVFGGAAFLWYWAGQASSQIATIPEHELPSIDSPGPEARASRTFLVIGSDSRDRIPTDFPDFFGGGENGQRADVIMLVRVDPGEDRVQILSIPRDLRVEIAGHGVDKINAAYAFGGPDLMVQTVKSVVATPVHHFVELDFFGFAAIVDALGGVDMFFPYPARDARSGLQVEAGMVHLDGPAALAYARSREYQELRDGRWVSIDADDLGRIRRQQRLVFAILEAMKRPSTLTELRGTVEAIGRHLTADSAFSTRSIIELAWALRSIGAEDLDAASLPVDFLTEGGIAYVVPREPEASQVLMAFRTGASLAVAMDGPIRLQVLNGNGVEGAAAGLAVRLESGGFEVIEVGDADRDDYQHTLVVARPEEISRARLVVEELGYGQVVPGAVPDRLDVIVIVGLDAVEA